MKAITDNRWITPLSHLKVSYRKENNKTQYETLFFRNQNGEKPNKSLSNFVQEFWIRSYNFESGINEREN